jgi:hypothetical protein
MSTLKKSWKYFIAEPYTWLFRCIFQPQAFRQATDQLSFRQRSGRLFRSIFPLFLFCYLIILIFSYLLYPLVLNNQRFEFVDEIKQFVADPQLYKSSPIPLSNTAPRVYIKNLIIANLKSGDFTIEKLHQNFVSELDYLGQVDAKYSLIPLYTAGMVLGGVLLGLSFGMLFNFRLALSYAISYGMLFGWFLPFSGIIFFSFSAQTYDKQSFSLYQYLTLWIMVGILASLAGSITGAFPQKLKINFNIEGRFVVALGVVLGALFSIFGQSALILALIGLAITIGIKMILQFVQQRRGDNSRKNGGLFPFITGGSVISLLILLGLFYFKASVPFMISGCYLGFLCGGVLASVAWGVEVNILSVIPYLITAGLLIGLLVFSIGYLINDFSQSMFLMLGFSSIFGPFLIIVVVMVISYAVMLLLMGGIVSYIRGGVASLLSATVGLLVVIMFGSFENLHLGLVFFIFFLVCFYRLPLYLISGTSIALNYFRSKEEPSKVFDYLQHSALYWDEKSYLPLIFLRRLLLLAADQNRAKTLKEIEFIAINRPQQVWAARNTLQEIVLAEMSERESLRDIAAASNWLGQYLPEDSTTLDTSWRSALSRLNEASREASRFLNTQSLQARKQSLDTFELSLRQLRSSTVFSNTHFNQQLVGIVEKWLAVAVRERAKLETEVEKAGSIYNPYIPGGLLDSRPLEQDNLFVGRRDIGLLLEEALAQGSRRPTFLLYGERRMGKTSALKQMPNLLGNRYLPVYLDLQNVSVRASIVGFFSALAQEISTVISQNGYNLTRLTTAKLEEAEAKNELAIYAVFDSWLKNIEQTLEKADKVLLITFDEFEKLEEELTQKALNLNLLLDWFRNTIQHRPRLALLYSGVKTFAEMGSGWSGYFVNVQNVKVSFLKPDDARLLITRPLPDFRGDQIYTPAVVEKIIQVTGCQPLLLQAVCSDLIKYLNDEEREKAEVPDVEMAVAATLESWGSYFDDLWNRTGPNERVCLETLISTEILVNDYVEVGRLTGLEPPIVRQAIQRLLRRDLLTEVKGKGYQLAIPMLSSWIRQYSDKIL